LTILAQVCFADCIGPFCWSSLYSEVSLLLYGASQFGGPSFGPFSQPIHFGPRLPLSLFFLLPPLLFLLLSWFDFQVLVFRHASFFADLAPTPNKGWRGPVPSPPFVLPVSNVPLRSQLCLYPTQHQNRLGSVFPRNFPYSRFFFRFKLPRKASQGPPFRVSDPLLLAPVPPFLLEVL